MKQSEYERAIECFDKAIELDPDNADAYWNKGVALSVFEDEEAHTYIGKALELDPSHDFADDD